MRRLGGGGAWIRGASSSGVFVNMNEGSVCLFG